VDILFANEEEIKALNGKSPEEGAKEAKGNGGSCSDQNGGRRIFLCITDQGTVRIGVRPPNPIDTTGAGDLYAAGFIYGHMKGLS
jgi:sugar/nucleoside kinase (ribokinase family)